MTRPELLAFFPGHTVRLGCENYEVTTLDWVQNKAWPAFRDWLFGMGCDKWTTRFECRDFARMFSAFCVVLWANTRMVGSSSDGVSVGEIWFNPAPGTGHAVCPVICDQGLVFVEPQTGAVYPLTPGQLASAYFLRF